MILKKPFFWNDGISTVDARRFKGCLQSLELGIPWAEDLLCHRAHQPLRHFVGRQGSSKPVKVNRHTGKLLTQPAAVALQAMSA